MDSIASIEDPGASNAPAPVPTPPCGLANMGNTCGINTLLQCITHTPPLVAAMVASGHAGQPLADEVHRVCRAIFEASGQSLLPQGAVRAIFDTFKDILVPGQQTDLTELWMLVADRLAGQWGKPRAAPEPRQPPERFREHPGIQRIHGLLPAVYDRYHEGKWSPWHEAIYGIQVVQTGCHAAQAPCPGFFFNLEPFLMLTLMPPSGGDGVPAQVRQGLERYINEERIPEWTCDVCKGTGATKLVRFYEFPQVLVLAIKRFSPNGQKTHDPVDISEGLAFPAASMIGPDGLRVVETAGGNATAATFRLMAIGNHHGISQGGHYNAVVRRGDRWYVVDDLASQDITGNIEGVLRGNRDAYLLFYERIL